MPKRTLSILSAVLIMLATRGQTAGQAAGPDLIQNGAFAEAGERGLARGWSVSGPMTRASLESGREGRACQKLETTGRSVFTLWQDVTVEPNATLYFTAWVKSGDRVVGRIGPLTMAYTEQGQWQQLVGLVRTGAAAKLKVEFL
ncbi:MAG: hypothetical protein FJ278_14990, partial [Planctomycetes bacterium]|nr:hypothetical protein [Planctomycetota bacterium]